MSKEKEKTELIVEMKTILSQIAKNEDIVVFDADIEGYIKINQLLKNAAICQEIERFKEICKNADEILN